MNSMKTEKHWCFLVLRCETRHRQSCDVCDTEMFIYDVADLIIYKQRNIDGAEQIRWILSGQSFSGLWSVSTVISCPDTNWWNLSQAYVMLNSSFSICAERVSASVIEREAHAIGCQSSYFCNSPAPSPLCDVSARS